MDAEYIVVGGGVVGLAVAAGLRRLERSVMVIDGTDTDFRASRGNFGLVWVQSKGIGCPDYARWSRRSAAAWPGFADELRRETGVDLMLVQEGGYDFFLSEQALQQRAAQYAELRDQLGGDYPFEVLDQPRLKREEPAVGPGVAGALFCPEDGHVNPLVLLRALTEYLARSGGRIVSGAQIASVEPASTRGFTVRAEDGRRFGCERVVLCAGLGAARLGPPLGFLAPVQPQRGQVLVTEKLRPLLRRPSVTIRQVNEGGVQIGDSKENVGYDDRETLATTAAIARRAVATIPALARARLVRSWAALRVMSPDGLPIYQRSSAHPGAFLVTCHSGITLAAAHCELLPKWLVGADDAPSMEVFGEARFNVRAAA
ncbi:MAG: FAD-binding oxidoreductase [Burkholderiales bacterium]|nr:MAG: FAD-binding oxidoreductase [Burkholderiales bacterium]